MEGQPLAGDQAQPGIAAGELGHRELGFQAAEVGAQAVVQALAEGQVPVGVGAVRVEGVGLGEGGRVPARGGQPQEQPGARGQLVAGQGDRAGSDPAQNSGRSPGGRLASTAYGSAR